MKEQLLRFAFLKHSIFFLLCSFGLMGQDVVSVLDENGLSLPGVNVYIDDVLSATTSADGMVEIDFSSTDNVRFTYLGYDDLDISSDNIVRQDYKVSLIPSKEILEEVIIVGRTNALSTDLPFNIEAIQSKEIKMSQAQTSADAIGKNGSVYVQKSQMGGGSPVIRGFEANKILLVVDGVRLNNAIYRSGHLQNAITVDPAILNRAELIFGPGSLLYGSDAIGGVIHFRTRMPLIDSDGFTGGSYLRYSSANHEKTGHVHFSMTNKVNLASLTSVSFSDFGDLRTGSRRSDEYPDYGKRFEYVRVSDLGDEIVQNEDVNRQIGTGYSQIDILQKFIYQPIDDMVLGLNMQLSQSSDIPRYDFLSEYSNGNLRFAEWNYGPQQRLMVAPNLEFDANKKLFDKILVNASYQKILESRLTRSFGSQIRESQIEDLHVWGLNVDFSKEISSRNKLEYGGSSYYNSLTSTASGENVFTGNTIEDVLTRYPSDGGTMLQAGFYLNNRYQIVEDVLSLDVGGRWSYQNVSFGFSQDDPFEWPAYYYDGIENENNAFVWMTGLNYKVKDFQFKFLAGSAFRAPNIDDLAKVRVKSDEITIPNPELKPERTRNLELNVTHYSKRLKFGVSGFYSAIDNIVIRDVFALPDGASTYITSGDTLLVTANVNGTKGQVFGLSANVGFEITDEFTFSGGINYTEGTTILEIGDAKPLDHIPPLYGKLELQYEKGAFDQRLVMQYNGVKDITLYGGSADNPEYALPEGTPAWQTFNWYGSYKVNNEWNVQMAVENIFDVHYRPFSSGVSAPGRNFIISLQYDW